MAKRKKDREARLQQHCERLGTYNPVCVECGQTDPRCFDMHHIAGQKYDDLTARVCRNCHAILSDDQKDHPDTCAGDPPKLECIGRMLLGLADFLALLIVKLREFGAYLIHAAQQPAPSSLE